MAEYIERGAVLDMLKRECSPKVFAYLSDQINAIPAADVVPWETLMRYANYFCALVSMPEFVREAKMFYDSTKAAMDGGNIE